MLPSNTARILISAGYESLKDFIVSQSGDVISLEWFHSDGQPTEQQIIAWSDDSTTLPNGQLFSQWLGVNGGNPIATRKRIAKEFHDNQQAENIALRATVKLLVDELNTLRQWLTDFKAATATAASLATLKTGVAALPNVPQRTYQQAKTAINNSIDGE